MDCRPAMRITRLTTIARTGRLTNRSVIRILTVLRLRGRLVGRLNLVVDQNGSAVAKLKYAGSDDLFLWLDPRKNRDLIAPRRPELHKLLAHSAVDPAVRILEVLDDNDGFPISRVAHGRSGQRHGCPACAQQHFRLNEHSGPQLSGWIGQRRLDLNVSSRRVDDGIDCRDAPGERSAGR